MHKHTRAFCPCDVNVDSFEIDLEGQQVHGSVQLLVLQGAGNTHVVLEFAFLVLWEREYVEEVRTQQRSGGYVLNALDVAVIRLDRRRVLRDASTTVFPILSFAMDLRLRLVSNTRLTHDPVAVAILFRGERQVMCRMLAAIWCYYRESGLEKYEHC
jgi:hypothetical protein